MDGRQRFVDTLLFKSVDKVPLMPGGGREKTLKRWHEEGLPEHVDPMQYCCDKLNLDFDEVSQAFPRNLHVEFNMLPKFEEKVLEHKNGHYIVQDWMGNITEISDEYDVTYIRNAKDFVTRKWHKFPVENWEDWEKMKERYNPDNEERFSQRFMDSLEKHKSRKYPIGIHFSGPFWIMREWAGFEPLCMMFIENEDLIRDMCEFWKTFVTKMLEKIFTLIDVDYIHASEDMAYKEKPMISPEMTEEFLMPCYDEWIRVAKQNGCRLFGIDSDGRIDKLIPVWINHEVNFCDPIEVAAGNDLIEMRKSFSQKMAYRGGVDKRCIAKGGKVIEDEVYRVCSILDGGGFIPSCDHGVPHDISLKNFVYYTELLAKKTGWL